MQAKYKIALALAAGLGLEPAPSKFCMPKPSRHPMWWR